MAIKSSSLPPEAYSGEVPFEGTHVAAAVPSSARPPHLPFHSPGGRSTGALQLRRLGLVGGALGAAALLTLGHGGRTGCDRGGEGGDGL